MGKAKRAHQELIHDPSLLHLLIWFESGAIDGHAPTTIVAEVKVIGGALPILRD
jgi:hypothetical protein